MVQKAHKLSSLQEKKLCCGDTQSFRTFSQDIRGPSFSPFSHDTLFALSHFSSFFRRVAPPKKSLSTFQARIFDEEGTITGLSPTVVALFQRNSRAHFFCNFAERRKRPNWIDFIRDYFRFPCWFFPSWRGFSLKDFFEFEVSRRRSVVNSLSFLYVLFCWWRGIHSVLWSG